MTRIRLLAIVFVAFLPSNCTTPLTSLGSQIDPVSEKQRNDNCEYIDIVTLEMDLQTLEGALNKARNTAAEMGGNSINLIHMDSDTDLFSSTVVFEVLKCE